MISTLSLSTSALSSQLLTLFLLCSTGATAYPIAHFRARHLQSSLSSLYARDDEDGYTEKAQNWCSDSPSECKAVVSILAVAGLFLILFIAFKWYRRRRRRQAKAKEELAETQAKEEKDRYEKEVEQKFFHRQREIKLRHEMEMLGLSDSTAK